MKNPITTDVFYSRDLIKYYEFITEKVIEDYNKLIKSDYSDYYSYSDEEIEEVIYGKHDILKEVDLYDEYEDLYNFISDLEDYCSDFKYGQAIIHEDHFVDYCEDLLKEYYFKIKTSGDLPNYIEINWEETANNMKEDYEEFWYDGATYFALKKK